MPLEFTGSVILEIRHSPPPTKTTTTNQFSSEDPREIEWTKRKNHAKNHAKQTKQREQLQNYFHLIQKPYPPSDVVARGVSFAH